ncbi:hypothetical protein [Streptomyces sp. NPDC002790]|uniref:hypothetical protein n=1 Tax=Streptomyces sp. NPDC002790 TaxID=3154431 RepID=UPI003330B257
MSRQDQINSIAADLAVAAMRGYDEFKVVAQEVDDRYPLEIKQEINARLADTTPNPTEG